MAFGNEQTPKEIAMWRTVDHENGNQEPPDLARQLKMVTVVFPIGTRVRKVQGSSWNGCVVGFYASSLTLEGYCVESEREPGSVQIYPARALEAI